MFLAQASNTPIMNREPALAALRIIDVAIHSSGHTELGMDDIQELHKACNGLLESVKDNAFATAKADWMVGLIDSAFLKAFPRPSMVRQKILDCATALSIFIQRLPEPN